MTETPLLSPPPNKKGKQKSQRFVMDTLAQGYIATVCTFVSKADKVRGSVLLIFIIFGFQMITELLKSICVHLVESWLQNTVKIRIGRGAYA